MAKFVSLENRERIRKLLGPEKPSTTSATLIPTTKLSLYLDEHHPKEAPPSRQLSNCAAHEIAPSESRAIITPLRWFRILHRSYHHNVKISAAIGPTGAPPESLTACATPTGLALCCRLPGSCRPDTEGGPCRPAEALLIKASPETE